MPRGKWIDKHSATTYQLVHRSQNDPLIHDESAQDRLLYQVSGPSTQSGKGLHIADLEDDFDFDNMRENEGEAANYGVYYDDTSYDYMQHLRDIGEGSSEAHFLDAVPTRLQGRDKGKGKVMKLEDALREASLDGSEDPSESAATSVFDENVSYISSTRREKTYQDQQEVPDEIAGFQPDMDPRLREVLEALEDDAYVDEKDEEEVFAALTQNGKHNEVDIDDFMQTLDDDEDDWESDATEKPHNAKESKNEDTKVPSVGSLTLQNENLSEADAEAASAEDGDWMKEFAKFKQATKSKAVPKPAETTSEAPGQSETQAPTLYTLGGTPLRKKKRKGALTNPSAYSMTSSSLARTDGQQLLDDRFDKVEALYRLDEDDEYMDDEDGGMSITSGMTGMSKMSKMSTLSTRSFADGPAREDLDSMMDGFLQGWEQGHPGTAKKKGKKGRKGGIGRGDDEVGIRTLDAVRKGLGPAIIPKAYRAQ